MLAGFEESSRQMKASGSHKQQGSMVTLALVCGHCLTVATAGTSQAHLDTGSHILLVSTALMPAAAAAVHEAVGPNFSDPRNSVAFMSAVCYTQEEQ